MSRLALLSPDTMTTRQKQVHDDIVSGPRGAVRGPLAVWLHRPDLADRAQALGQYCRYETTLPSRLSELAILTTARVWRAEFEWAAHKPLGLKAGLSSDVIEAIRTDSAVVFEHDDEAVVYEVSKTLHVERQIDDALYARATSVLGEKQLVDLIGILGYYTLISMTINAFGVPAPEGFEPELT